MSTPKTEYNQDIIAFYRHNFETYRVIDYVDDWCIEKIDGTGGRWFSTHSGLTLLADLQMALSSYFNTNVLQKDIDITI